MSTASEGDVYALVVGRVILHLRQSRGWSQEQLARAAGLTQPTLSRLERGQGLPDLHVVRRIAYSFGMSTAQLAAHVDDAFETTEQVARTALAQVTKKNRPWWQAAVLASGLAGFAGLVAFAVSSALDAKKDPGKSRG
jgi:transcriptional regulator with XRE-family HTH domain